MLKNFFTIIFIFNSFFSYSQDLIPIKVDGLWGYCDKNKKIQILPHFEDAKPFIDNYSQVKINNKWMTINKYGINEFTKYDFVYKFQEGIAGVELNDKFGFINKKGEEVIPLIYDKEYGLSMCWNARWERIWFWDGNKFGMINFLGDTLVHPKYDMYITYSKPGFYVVTLDSKKGIVDENGIEIVPTKYDNIGQGFYNGLCDVKLDNKVGYVNKEGIEVIPLKYDFAFIFKNGVAVAEEGGKFGLIDTLGNIQIPFLYDDALDWCEFNRYGVKLKGKWGFVDKTNKIKIPLKYDKIQFFNSYGVTVATSYINGKSHSILLDTLGNEIANFENTSQILHINRKGFNSVRKEGYWGAVDNSGEIVIPFIYKSIGFMTEENILTQDDNKYYFYNSKGKRINDKGYDYAENFKNGLAYVRNKGNEFYIDKDGKEFIIK